MVMNVTGGAIPAASASVQLQRRAENGDWFTVPSGIAVRPNEPIRIVYAGFGFISGVSVTVEITIITGIGDSIVYGPVRDQILFGSGNQVTTAPPAASLASFAVIVERISLPFSEAAAFA